MPVKVVPPVLITKQSLTTKQQIGPITIMSGFMTKKGRTLNRWKQRWWQLLDNGYLFYFKSDDRHKILGQIDIARTCYDVRLGSEKCRVAFPRAAPSCCCISFAVLKRNYYMYTPTAKEAEKWAQALSSTSQVINRRVFAGVERRKAPDPPGPYRFPSCPPPRQVKMTRVKDGNGIAKSDSYDDFKRIKHSRSNTNLVSQRVMAMSVPDYLNKIVDDNVSLSGETGSLGSRLWLDGSPPPPARSSLIHPHDEPPTAEISWGSPTTNRASPPNTPTEIRSSKSPLPPKEDQVIEFDPLNDQQRLDSTTSQDQQKDTQCDSEGTECYNSPGGGNTSHTSKRILSKGRSISLDDLHSSEFLIQVKPVPKPRKPRSLTKPAEDVKVVVTQSSLQPEVLDVPEMRPRNNSEPPPIRRRKCSTGTVPKKSHRSSKGRRRSRRLSPPSTPPPPPPPIVNGELPPKPAGPPKFVPPPPPSTL